MRSIAAWTSCWRTRRRCSVICSERWQDLFGAKFDVLLYDLTSTYFESEPPADENDKRRYGYSRDKRSDCVQVVIALIVTPEGFPLAYEVLAGNTSDKTTLRDFLHKIETQYGKAKRIWVMDRGIPTEEVLAEMRAAAIRRSTIWSARPRGGSANWSKHLLDAALASGARGRRGQAAAAGARTLRAGPEPRRASTRNAPCAGASSSGCGRGSSNSRP